MALVRGGCCHFQDSLYNTRVQASNQEDSREQDAYMESGLVSSSRVYQ